eukprot:TRINITY_DN117463_c0_g1_i1.p1 TRINITY_DN117463_c0_g1~~TRINITY_DN117463_c0_g1_i1.p1  ORF type:complete len:266 (-),score=24.81 TRINITY_DN117463_c0_g1_i1:71-802(-)
MTSCSSTTSAISTNTTTTSSSTSSGNSLLSSLQSSNTKDTPQVGRRKDSVNGRDRSPEPPSHNHARSATSARQSPARQRITTTTTTSSHACGGLRTASPRARRPAKSPPRDLKRNSSGPATPRDNKENKDPHHRNTHTPNKRESAKIQTTTTSGCNSSLGLNPAPSTPRNRPAKSPQRSPRYSDHHQEISPTSTTQLTSPTSTYAHPRDPSRTKVLAAAATLASASFSNSSTPLFTASPRDNH